MKRRTLHFSMIHSTAVISSEATIGKNVKIGPYSIIGDHVVIGDDCILHSHVVMDGHTTIGERNEFFPFTMIGGKSQDLKFNGGSTYLMIGSDNIFRENTTIHCSTHDDAPTRIGSHNLFLCYSHVAHNCQVGNHVIFSNNGTLAGHVEVEDHVILSGFAAAHQFCRIGAHSIVGGFTKIIQDVAPYTIVDGVPAEARGVNLVGLQRRGFSEIDIRAIKFAYKKIFLSKTGNLTNAIATVKDTEYFENIHCKKMITFIEETKRGMTR
jgi:UDP-N-acetylglucosamine acyltransferase